MNKRYIVRLAEQERANLTALVKKPKGKVNAASRRHAHILLLADQGEHGTAWRDEDIAMAVAVHMSTVRAVRERLVEEGLDSALVRKPQCRPSRVRKLDGVAEAKLIAVACSPPPQGRAAWTMQLLADRLVELKIIDSISRETVRETLKKTR